MKFNRLRIKHAVLHSPKTIPCIRWEIGKRAPVEIHQEPEAVAGNLCGVILDLDCPLEHQSIEKGKEPIC